MAADTKKIIGVAAIVTVGVGTANAYLKDQKPPSTRFLIGVGMTFFILSAMSEFPTGDEIAKGLAMGVMTTVLLSGEAGGLLAYIDKGEMNTNPKKKEEQNPEQRDRPQVQRTVHVVNPLGNFRPDTIAAIPGIPQVSAAPARRPARRPRVFTSPGFLPPPAGPGRPVGFTN